MLDAGNARIFGSDKDAVHIGPLGTVLPTTLAAPGPALVHAGWLGPDGTTMGGDSSVNRLRGHQGGRVVRSKIPESGTNFTFVCLETTALTLGLQHNIKEHTTTAGVTTMRVSAGKKIETRSFVLDFYDEDETELQYRYTIPRGEIGERSEVKLTNKDITAYSFNVEVIGDFFIVTNDGAVAVV